MYARAPANHAGVAGSVSDASAAMYLDDTRSRDFSGEVAAIEAARNSFGDIVEAAAEISKLSSASSAALRSAEQDMADSLLFEDVDNGEIRY